MRFIFQMARIPMLALNFGLDLVTSATNELQRAAAGSFPPPAIGPNPVGAVGANTFKESIDMDDQDLSSDDLKVVRFRIIFKKRDYETTLHSGEALVNYPTDGGSYGALQIMNFFQRVAEGRVRRPAKWKEMHYPSGSHDTKWVIPPDDRRYIGFLFEVVRREEREEKDYDRQQVMVLREIAHRLDRQP